MREQVLGTTAPVLSIWLDLGESVVAEAGDFAWMTDSIEMAMSDRVRQEAGEARHELRLCAYTATGEPGVVAFASKRPGRILDLEVGPGDEGYLVRESGFLAGTPGVRVAADAAGPTGKGGGQGLALWRIGGSGRAWVWLPGDVTRRELTAGQSLRAHPGHIGMFGATVALQVAEVPGISGRDPYSCAVISGPGPVWLQSIPVNPRD
jgi:uncharacterized protein (AIM24 family)